MIGDVSFYYPWFKPSLHYRVCDDMVNPAGSLSRVGLLIVRIIPKRNIRNTKFWTLLFASKSSKLILNSPAKITSLREISRFERKREGEREREFWTSTHKHSNALEFTWRSFLDLYKFPAKKYRALLPCSFLWLDENYNILAAENLNQKFHEVEARFLKGRLH